jgi:pimeloyl-ACP methyl ester carboxylesterase
MTTVALHHTEFGPTDGLAVLALHGWTPDHRLMTGCLEPVFAARTHPYRRLYPDMPGMGATPAGSVASSDDMLASLESYVDEHVGDGPLLVIGESYGGYLARAITRRRRRQVAGLALVCPIGRAVLGADRDVPLHIVLVRDPALGDMQGSGFDDVAVVQTHETYRRTQDEIVVGLEIADQAALDRIQQQWVLSDDPEDAEPIMVPTAIVTGRQDASTGYRDVWSILEHYPRASFAVLDRAGHNLQIEQPRLFTAITAEWLDRVEESLATWPGRVLGRAPSVVHEE